ncbi:MAG: DUF4139 domain-containing protein, partial [Candidatus Caldipriscus sp.]
MLLLAQIYLDFPKTADSVVISPNGAYMFTSLGVKGEGRLEVVIRGIPSDQDGNVSVIIKNGIIMNREFKTVKLPYDKGLYERVQSEIESHQSKISSTKGKIAEVEYYINLLNAILEGVKAGKVDNFDKFIKMSQRLERYYILRDSLMRVLNETNRVLDSIKNISANLLTVQGEMKILVENAKDPTLEFRIFYPSGFITLETEYLMYYSSNKIKVSSVGKIRANLPTKLDVKNLIITNLEPSFSAPTHQPWYIMDQHYPELMKAITLQEKISPQSEGEIDINFTRISTRFEVKRQITLDRFKPALIVLFEREYEAREIVSCYPELSQKGYLSAIFKPDMDLLPGNLKVFLNGELSAEYYFNGSVRDAEDTVFLGFDPFIVGDVKVINQTREDIKGKQPLTREKREYVISIQNLRKTPTDLIIYARKPFAAGNVNITKFEVYPKPKEDLGDGLLVWEKRLQGGEKFEIRRVVEITYPKGSIVNW